MIERNLKVLFFGRIKFLQGIVLVFLLIVVLWTSGMFLSIIILMQLTLPKSYHLMFRTGLGRQIIQQLIKQDEFQLVQLFKYKAVLQSKPRKDPIYFPPFGHIHFDLQVMKSDKIPARKILHVRLLKIIWVKPIKR